MSKVTVERKALGKALAALSAVTPKCFPNPALLCAKVSVNGDVAVTATDLETTMTVRLPREGHAEEFQTLIPMNRLSKYVKASKAPSLTLETGKDEVTLDGFLSVPTVDLSEYPAATESRGRHVATLDAKEFASGIREVLFARSEEIVRYALTGILLEVREAGVYLVTSDGKRLASRKLKPIGIWPEARIILPARSAEAIAKLCDLSSDAMVDVLVHEEIPEGEKNPVMKEVHIRAGGNHLWFRPVEGFFPDWEAVTPTSCDVRWAVDRAALADALGRMAPAFAKILPIVRLSFGNGKLRLLAKKLDVGEAKAEIPAVGDKPLKIWFDPMFLFDYLKSLPKAATALEIRASKPDRATTWVSPGAPGLTYVLMPRNEA